MPCGASTAHLLVPCPRHRLLQSRSLSCCACAPVSLPWHSACGITGIFSKFYCHAQFFVLLSSQGETWWKCFSLLWFQWREVFPCWVPKKDTKTTHGVSWRLYALKNTFFFLYPLKMKETHVGFFMVYLVGGWTNPFEKYLWNWIISPGRDEHKKSLKPPPSILYSLTKTD